MEQENINLRRFRKENQLSQKELAEFLGVTCGFISLIENGKAKLPEDKLKRLIIDGKNDKGWQIGVIIPAPAQRLRTLANLVTTRSAQKGYVLDTEPLIGLTSQQIESFETMGATVTREVAERVKEKLPNLNTEWLLTGEGKAFIKEDLDDDDIRQELQSVLAEIDGVKEELKEIKEMLRSLTQHK